MNVEPQQNEPIEPDNEPVQTNNVEPVEPQQEPVNQVQTPEENAKFAQVRREAEARARDKVIADMGMTWEGRPISTYDDYVKAKEASDQMAKEQAIRDKYQSQGLPEEVIEELVESKKFRQSYESDKQKLKDEERKQAEYREFLNISEMSTGKTSMQAKIQFPRSVGNGEQRQVFDRCLCNQPRKGIKG